jgi:hypothetical protein
VIRAQQFGSGLCSIFEKTREPVAYITGDYVPADPQGWVDSLAPYRWACLASQTIAYGCATS